jgi:outer membrane lipoprotein SlyB
MEKQGKKSVEIPNATVAIYRSHKEAVEAIHKLQEHGFSIDTMSIIGKGDFVEDVKGAYTLEDVSNDGMTVGGIAGGLLGALAGLSMVAIPGVGLLYTGGFMGAVVLSALTLDGAAIGAFGGGLFASILGSNLDKEGVLEYERHIDNGKYLLVLHTDNRTAKRAKEILHADSDHDGVNTH